MHRGRIQALPLLLVRFQEEWGSGRELLQTWSLVEASDVSRHLHGQVKGNDLKQMLGAWSTVPHEKQILNWYKFAAPFFNKIKNFAHILGRNCNVPLSWIRWTKSTTTTWVFKTDLMLNFHLSLGLRSGPFVSDFPKKTLQELPLFQARHMLNWKLSNILLMDLNSWRRIYLSFKTSGINHPATIASYHTRTESSVIPLSKVQCSKISYFLLLFINS